jgi:hypothetical protein
MAIRYIKRWRHKEGTHTDHLLEHLQVTLIALWRRDYMVETKVQG